MDLTLALARQAAAAAEKHAEKLGINVAVSVVDDGGNRLLFHRMDGTQLASTVIAEAKAYTASSWRRPSGELATILAMGRPGFGINLLDQRFTMSAGGIPLRIDGRVAGAIGVSGGTSEQDEECAKAGGAEIGAE